MKLRKVLVGTAAAAAALAAQVPAHAWTYNAHYWASVGLFSRFNVVTRDDFQAKNSDMQCGFAAGGNAKLIGGYSVGESGVQVDNAAGKPQLGILVSGNFDWTGYSYQGKDKNNQPIAVNVPASGTIDGSIIWGGGPANISPNSPITLKPGSTIIPANGAQLLTALSTDPELWRGWGDDTGDWGTSSLQPNGKLPGQSGWPGGNYTAHQVPLGSAVRAFYDSYLKNEHKAIWITSANGKTEVYRYTTSSTDWSTNPPTVLPSVDNANITLDGQGLKRCDMPGNNAGNCSATGGANTQPGGRRMVHIFDVDAADLSKARVVNLKNIPWVDEFNSRGWIIVKVNGKGKVRMQNIGLNDFAPHNDRTLWIFDDEITEIELGSVAKNEGGVGVEGTILARFAKVTAVNGQINGTIIAKSFVATGSDIPNVPAFEGHCKPFVNYIDP